MSKKFAYGTTRITEHPDHVFPSLCQVVGFDNLYVGQVIDRNELREKILFFQKYSDSKGSYVVEKCYNGGERGLHYFNWETLLIALERFGCSFSTPKCIVRYQKGLYFDPVLQ